MTAAAGPSDARSVNQALVQATQTLRAGGIADAAIDARYLLAYALETARDRLSLMGPDPMPMAASARLQQALQMRLSGRPVAKITGQRLFWGRDFIVTDDVLDPRPDTETLIAAALQGPAPERFLDLGVGSGAIAVTLLAEWPDAQGCASDISAPALAVARRNARRHGVDTRLTLVQSDWFSELSGQFDLVISNPPYISAAEMADLAPEVRDHDPHLALSPGGDGLDPYHLIAAQVARFLRPGGQLMVEIGWKQGADVGDIFRNAGLEQVNTLADMEGRDRVISARMPG